jgi:hypothetical protein
VPPCAEPNPSNLTDLAIEPNRVADDEAGLLAADLVLMRLTLNGARAEHVIVGPALSELGSEFPTIMLKQLLAVELGMELAPLAGPGRHKTDVGRLLHKPNDQLGWDRKDRSIVRYRVSSTIIASAAG